MSWQEIYREFITGIQQTSMLEFVAVVFGIASVLFSRKENILVFPTGIVNTVLYTWFCFSWWDLYAEGSLNFYYTAMSIYGWYAWSGKSSGGEALHITPNNKKDWSISIGFFLMAWALLFFILKTYTKSTVPLGDSFASAAAYTGMWQMARKKIENWMWWVLTNLASVPLYFSKGAVFTSVQYVVFLILAIIGWIEWHRKYHRKHV
jgi:nicotinamide mononucleotide transporter